MKPENLEWIISSPDRLVPLERLQDGNFSLEGNIVERITIENAFAKNDGYLPSSIEFIQEQWKVVQIKPFRPIIYYAAFHDDEIFRCLLSSIRSLVCIGEYDGDIAVITSPDKVMKIEYISSLLNIDKRLHIVCVDKYADIVDFYLSRFRIEDQVFDFRQPIVYLDTDVVIDKPIEPFLMAVSGSDKLHVVPEGRLDEGHPESAGHWYGWRMMAEDGMPFHLHDRGFSSGIIAAGQENVARNYFNIVLTCAEGFQKKTGKRRPFLGYDQCVANYVFLKTGVRSFDIIEKNALLLRLKSEDNFTIPSSRRGFVHFLNVPTCEKRKAMELYVEYLIKEKQNSSVA